MERHILVFLIIYEYVQTFFYMRVKFGTKMYTFPV